MIREIPRKALNGILALLLLTAGSFAAGALVISGARQEDAPLALLGAAGPVSYTHLTLPTSDLV